MEARLQQQIRFILEIDRLKNVLRQTVLTDGSRRENTAEHSWHIAMMVLVLSEHADRAIDPIRVLKMLLVHDIVEIDAGDTFCYDEEGNRDKAEREQRAADRIFGLLPVDQGTELRELWDEFEEQASDDSKFAHAIDRMQPVLQNLSTEGHSWRVHGVRREQVIERNSPIGDGSRLLWREISRRIDALFD